MDDVRDLLAQYGQLTRQDRVTAETIGRIIQSLLHQSVPRTQAIPHLMLGETLFFIFDGGHYLLTYTDPDRPRKDWAAYLRRVHEYVTDDLRTMHSHWVHVHWHQEHSTPDEQMIAAMSGLGVLVDRTHLEAAATGLLPLAQLVHNLYSRRLSHAPLAQLLASETAAQAWHLSPPARLISPPAVETRTWAGVVAEVLLIGQPQQTRPTGLAWLSDNKLLMTCQDGLLNIDLTRGHAHWHLPLPGCYGAPLVCDDGVVWVMCGSALVRWNHGELDAVAGGFEDGAVLLPGPDGEPWVLSGSGVTFGSGDGTLALTRAGERTGEQMRYPITFEAAVRSAVWLDRRRFFLAASGHSAVINLARTTDAGQREEWIPTPVHFPAHVLLAGAESVLSASSDGSGNTVAVHRTDLTVRDSEPLAEARLGEVLGLTQRPGDGPAYLLASLPDNDHTHVRLILMSLTGYRTPAPRTSPARVAPAVGYDAVSQSARGERRDYGLDRLPLAREGQAEVFRAVHKATDTVVAFKRRTSKGQRAARRMSREVEAALRFGGNPHVMPILDFSPDHDWFVMPLAEATVEDKRTELQDPTQLRTLVSAVAAGLADAHRSKWIHRDIKPSNILFLDGRWTVADWGIVRRARGETSTAGLLTRAGIGTEGFAAPELSVNGHNITPASDIYSLGQLIGWIFTGTWPQANVPLLPPPGPWYGVVRQATQLDPAQRPQDVDAFLALVERMTGSQDEFPFQRATRLLEDANERDDTTAAARLLTLAADQPDFYELYLDVVTKLDVRAAETALFANPQQTTAVLNALTEHSSAYWAAQTEATRAIWWLLNVAGLAAQEEQWRLLDAAVQGMCAWDGRWDRWDPRNSIRDWLITLTGDAAATVASALRAQPAGARFYDEVIDDRRADLAIRSAIHAAQRT
ncbi:serine/threonine protein kinase [Streptomyces sp. GMY02]|uniref:serine/threonine-protein kinase n=1 Tax=Streptomyces sp. GMY02 TaxID=1333528 RepID=UPI001C2C086A|nr:serine/threonine-protein kinase [Streptomyces sp. GMY02]QXE34426.1 serine/threonine protein kinase [Streptomyces sp. GMY02]